MYRLMLIFMCVPLLSREIQFSYFDRNKYTENNFDTKQFLEKIPREEVESGYILSLSYPLNSAPTALSLHAASSLSRWDVLEDAAYAYSTYLTARFSPFSVIFLSPYVELSLAGPTYLSKASLGEIDFGSSVIYQHYVAAGLKLGAVMFDIKMINYSKSLPSAFTKESKTMPLILSVGCNY